MGGSMKRSEALKLIEAELDFQNEKWDRPDGEFPGDKLAILAEEFGEVARAILEGNPSELRSELAQVAAVSAAWLMAEFSAPLGHRGKAFPKKASVNG